MHIVLTIILLGVCDAHNILFATPNAVKSESNFAVTLAYELAKGGNKVTFISGYKGPSDPNLNVIWLPKVQNIHENVEVDSSLQESTESLYNLIASYYGSQNELVWDDERVLEIWKKRNEFDLFVTMSYYSEGTFPFLMNTTVPMVQIISMGSEHLVLSRAGNWIPPSVLPSMLTEYTEDMTFWERTINMISTVQFHNQQSKVVPRYMEPVMKVFPNFGDPLRYYDRVALTLINGHFAMDGPLPLLPNQVEIGGLHIKKPKPLDDELSTFVNGAGDAGIIYFSLGSLVKSSDLSQSIKETLLKAFSRLPQRVLWKYEDTDLKLPPNVLIKKWMPQQDILAHTMTKAFISHCGTFGVQEAKFFGVPILAMPVEFDQPRNAAKLTRQGYGITLLWKDLKVEDIVYSLKTLINDKSYRKRAKAVSRVLQDQKEAPLERAIWWIEYVARHKGAPHLQYAGKRLSLFQYIMLDVILVWLGLFAVISFGIFYVMKRICCKMGSEDSAWKKKYKKEQ